MEVEGKQYYNRHPRVRKFIELNDLQQHTGHEGKTKHLKDHKKDQRKKQTETDRGDIQKEQQNNTRTNKQQSMDQWNNQGSPHRILTSHLFNVECLPHYQMQIFSFAWLYNLILVIEYWYW